MEVNQGLTGVTLETHSSSTVAFSFLNINLTYLGYGYLTYSPL